MPKKSREERKTERQARREARIAAREQAREHAKKALTEPRTYTSVPARDQGEDLDFSIVLPSRERVPLLTQLLRSIEETTDRIDRVEVLVGIDDDDSATCGVVPELQERFPFVEFQVGARWNNLSVGYYNLLALASRGRFVLLLNDDTRFTTRGWDTLSLAVIESVFPDKLFLGRTADDTGCQNDKGTTGYSCFPLLPREVIDVWGFAQQPGFASWGADIHLHKVFAGLKREVNLPIEIEHLCCHNGTARRDQVSRRMGRLATYAYGTVEQDRAKIVEAIKNATTGA